jgi:uncharacterized membrane protein YccC
MDSSVWLNLGVSLIGTMVGVLLAFRLNRAWESRQSGRLYCQQLNACRYDLASLRSILSKIQDQVAVGSTNILEVEAPALRALLASPNLQEHCPHGFAVVLTAVSALITTTGNVMTQYRLAATTGGTLTAQGVADIRNRTAQLIRGLDYIQQLIDQELRRFRVGVAKTTEDTEKMDGFAKALRGDK